MRHQVKAFALIVALLAVACGTSDVKKPDEPREESAAPARDDDADARAEKKKAQSESEAAPHRDDEENVAAGGDAGAGGGGDAANGGANGGSGGGGGAGAGGGGGGGGGAQQNEPVRLVKVYQYDARAADGTASPYNRGYWIDTQHVSKDWTNPKEEYDALADDTHPKARDCGAAQLVQCYRRSVQAFFLVVGRCDNASDEELYRLPAYVCTKPAANTSPLVLLGSTTYGSATTANQGTIDYAINQVHFQQIRVVGYAPTQGF